MRRTIRVLCLAVLAMCSGSHRLSAQTGPVTANPVFTSNGMLQSQVTIPLSVPGSGSKTVTVNVLGHATIS